MKASKVTRLLILLVIGLVLTLFVWVLWPTTMDVSQVKDLAPLLNAKVKTTKTLYLHDADEGEYRFHRHVLSYDSVMLGERKYTLAPGSELTITKFETYKSNAGSGFTYLYVLGTWNSPDGEALPVEFDWAALDNIQDGQLPLSFWQKAGDAPLRFEK
jgi:hypothetical protein